MARATLRDDLHAVHSQLTSRVLATTSPDDSPANRITTWTQTEGPVLERAMTTLEEIGNSRMWAGIHFQSDVDAGLALGKGVGDLVVEHVKGMVQQ